MGKVNAVEAILLRFTPMNVKTSNVKQELMAVVTAEVPITRRVSKENELFLTQGDTMSSTVQSRGPLRSTVGRSTVI